MAEQETKQYHSSSKQEFCIDAGLKIQKMKRETRTQERESRGIFELDALKEIKNANRS